MNFGATVRGRMAERGINNVQLAGAMGFSVQYVSALLAGKKRWNETTMTKACLALGLKINLVALERTGTTDD